MCLLFIRIAPEDRQVVFNRPKVYVVLYRDHNLGRIQRACNLREKAGIWGRGGAVRRRGLRERAQGQNHIYIEGLSEEVRFEAGMRVGLKCLISKCG